MPSKSKVRARGSHSFLGLSRRPLAHLAFFPEPNQNTTYDDDTHIHWNRNSNEPCPNIASGLSRFWGMLLWPIYVMGWGLVVGYVVAKMSQTPRSQMRSLLAACAFPNATAIPIALLAALRLDFPHTANLGSTNPMPYLSIYLLTYPILQWSVGGWLLSQPSAQDDDDDDDDSFVEMDLDEESHDDDEEAVVHECNVTKQQQVANDKSLAPRFETMSTEATALLLESQSSLSQDNVSVVCSTCSSSATNSTNSSSRSSGWCSCTGGGGAWKHQQSQQHSKSKSGGSCGCSLVLGQVLRQVLQPPVVGAASGFLVASVSPLRAQLVDMTDRNGNAPLEWAFAALFAVGQAAVPINMIILGVNLSQSLQKPQEPKLMQQLQGLDITTNGHEDNNKNDDDDKFTMSNKTMVWLVVGKLIIMPVIGCLSVVVFDANWWHLSHGECCQGECGWQCQDGITQWLLLLLLFCCQVIMLEYSWLPPLCS